MPPLSPISFKQFEKFLISQGCIFKRQTGSHRIYDREDLLRPIVVPKKKEVVPSLIRSNLNTLKISPEEYLKILQTL